MKAKHILVLTLLAGGLCSAGYAQCTNPNDAAQIFDDDFVTQAQALEPNTTKSVIITSTRVSAPDRNYTVTVKARTNLSTGGFLVDCKSAPSSKYPLATPTPYTFIFANNIDRLVGVLYQNDGSPKEPSSARPSRFRPP